MDEIISNWKTTSILNGKFSCIWECSLIQNEDNIQISIKYDPQEKEFSLYVVENNMDSVFEITDDYKRIYQLIGAVTFDEIEPPSEEEFYRYCERFQDESN